uniref:C2H2-type domain-containing protein n=1 Tax=Aegilops tauschii subsp. strangulata TaxID=200361 RepID=A0A453NC12_AEGTS
NTNNHPACPLCRGDVIGWAVIGEARQHLNQKKRCCEESCCSYVGNFHELQKHTQQKHPNSRPSEIDPARRVDWENFQQSSDIIDVLSTIHAQGQGKLVDVLYFLQVFRVFERPEKSKDKGKEKWWKEGRQQVWSGKLHHRRSNQSC